MKAEAAFAEGIALLPREEGGHAVSAAARAQVEALLGHPRYYLLSEGVALILLGHLLSSERFRRLLLFFRSLASAGPGTA